jgi:hypothetical protein
VDQLTAGHHAGRAHPSQCLLSLVTLMMATNRFMFEKPHTPALSACIMSWVAAESGLPSVRSFELTSRAGSSGRGDSLRPGRAHRDRRGKRRGEAHLLTGISMFCVASVEGALKDALRCDLWRFPRKPLPACLRSRRRNSGQHTPLPLARPQIFCG